MGVCFRDFWAKFTWPWAPTQRAIFLAKVVYGSRLSSESLEHLIVFLAYLEPQLWLKNQLVVKFNSHKR